MKDLFDIVTFYKKIENENLYANFEYNDEEYDHIEHEIEKINQQFLELVRKSLTDYKFNHRSLLVIVNDLVEIYDTIKSDLLYRIIPKIENTPLFRYKIEFNNTLLTLALGKIAITAGISDLYRLLEKYLGNEFKFSNDLVPVSFVPPYLDEMGYKRHIYLKFMKDDFLEQELYGRKDFWVKKLDEFYSYVSPKVSFSLPIDYSKRKEIGSDLFHFFPETFTDKNRKSSIKQGKQNPVISKYIKKPKTENNAMWFKNLPDDKGRRTEFYESLKDIYEYIRKYCPNSNWNDFKSIFNEQGVKSKIVWTGNTDVLRFLFTCFGSNIKYKGKKWEVITFYFIPHEGKSFDSEKLPHNNKYKDQILYGLIRHLFQY